jgi:hypothetical protein
MWINLDTDRAVPTDPTPVRIVPTSSGGRYHSKPHGLPRHLPERYGPYRDGYRPPGGLYRQRCDRPQQLCTFVYELK